MDITRLIEALGRPDAYPHAVTEIEIRQTHISVVALAGPYAYKVKKPVDLGFLDFTTLEKRRHFCDEEVRLNRRLAPDVYLGVVPLVEEDGRLIVEGAGPPVEHAVKMRRLPDDATLLAALERGALSEEILDALGTRIAAFHSEAASGPEIDPYGRWVVVARNARENLEQSREHVGLSVSHQVFGRLERLLERRLLELRERIEARAEAHVPRDTHGDLHLEHVYLFPDEVPPGDLVIIDCIEFNERFRYADPVADIAFLAMDLTFRARPDLARPLVEAYFREAGDPEGRALLPFYVAYRAAVRAKVDGMTAEEAEIPPRERKEAISRARGHWLLALSELEDPDRRPCLVLVGGLPGTGKTTLAEALGHMAGFRVVSSDRVRKELAGLPPSASAAAPYGEGIYTPEWNERTYEACSRRARALLYEGERVIVDASFREAARRRAFLDIAATAGVRSIFLRCTARPETVRERMDDRRRGASDADWRIYRAAAASWEAGGELLENARIVPTDGSLDESLAAARAHLRESGLAG